MRVVNNLQLLVFISVINYLYLSTVSEEFFFFSNQPKNVFLIAVLAEPDVLPVSAPGNDVRQVSFKNEEMWEMQCTRRACCYLWRGFARPWAPRLFPVLWISAPWRVPWVILDTALLGFGVTSRSLQGKRESSGDPGTTALAQRECSQTGLEVKKSCRWIEVCHPSMFLTFLKA